MFVQIVFTIIFGLFSYYVVKYVKKLVRYYSLLFKLKYPKWTPVVGHLLEMYCDEITVFNKIRQWSRDFGPVYLVSAFYLIAVNISGPEEFEVVSSSMKHTQKATVYYFLHNWLGAGLLTSKGSQWQTRRKILTPTFHFSILQDFVTVFNKESDKLIKILKEKVGKPINVVPIFSQCTLSTIVETAMGAQLNLQNESDNNYIKAIHKMGKIFYYRVLRPWTYFNFYYYNFHRQGQQENKLVKILNDFTNKVIKKREENFETIKDIPTDDNEHYYGKKKIAMLDLMLNAKLTDGSIDDKGIRDEVNTFMFEGHDTTSMALTFTLMMLAYHKNVQDHVYEEITQNLAENQKHFTLKELNDLNYMECVIKECLRLYPIVPFIARTLEEEVQLKNGCILPEGSQVFIHIFDIHRNPKYWSDPEKFDPDRFLPENCVSRHPFAFVPFSAGPRNCIGQKFAMLEIKAVLTAVLRNFIVESVDTPETLVLVPDMVLRAQNLSVLVKFENRNGP